jgi:hypothetical protein
MRFPPEQVQHRFSTATAVNCIGTAVFGLNESAAIIAWLRSLAVLKQGTCDVVE